jgi:hypothetical protein
VTPMDPTRRLFLRIAGLIGLGTALAMTGCGRGGDDRSSQATGGVAQKVAREDSALAASGAEPRPCDDVTGLTPQQIELRETFGYVEVSPEPELECHHCEFYKAPAAGEYCGGCTLFPGPVSPEGHCDSFSEA